MSDRLTKVLLCFFAALVACSILELGLVWNRTRPTQPEPETVVTAHFHAFGNWEKPEKDYSMTPTAFVQFRYCSTCNAAECRRMHTEVLQ